MEDKQVIPEPTSFYRMLGLKENVFKEKDIYNEENGKLASEVREATLRLQFAHIPPYIPQYIESIIETLRAHYRYFVNEFSDISFKDGKGY